MKLALCDNLGGSFQVYIAIFHPYLQRASGSIDVDRVAHQTPRESGGRRASRSGSGTHGLPCASLEKPDIQRVIVHHPNKGYVGAMRETRVPFQLRSQRFPIKSMPVEFEIVHKYGALRIPDV